MTSKISFRKILSEIISHRLWIIILISAVAALAFPLGLQTVLHEVLSDVALANTDTGTWYVLGVLGTEGGYTYIFLCIAAVICAASSFAYLNSKEKTDFYHSFAVRRESIFVSRWLSGFLIAVVPYATAMLVSIFIILPVNGLFTPDLAGTLVGNMFFFIFAYAAVYSVCVLAMTFSGRILTGLFLMAVFLGYVPCVHYVLRGLLKSFYPVVDAHLGFSWGVYTSPISLAALIGNGLGNTVACWIILAIFLVGGFFAALYVHKIRPSETAGQSMTFPVLKSIIKIIVGVLVALVVGFIGVLFNGEGSVTVFIIWALVGAFLINLFIEFLYGTDIKSVFKKWISALIMFAVVVATIIVMVTDPAGVNTWIPNKQNVKRMSVHTDILTDAFGAFNTNEMSNETALLDGGLIEEFDSIYAIAEEGINEYKKGTYKYRDEVVISDDDVLTQVLIEYEMDNGKKVYRNYIVPYSALSRELRSLSDSKEFREKCYPTLTADLSGYKEVMIESAKVSSTGRGHTIARDKIPELIEAIRLDSEEVNVAEILDETPILEAHFEKNGKEVTTLDTSLYSNYYYTEGEYCQIHIFPQYERTLTLLREITGNNSIGN